VSSFATLPNSETIYTALDEWRNGKKLTRNTQRVNPAIIRKLSWTDWRTPQEIFQDIHSPIWNSGIFEYKEAKRFRFQTKILLQHNLFLISCTWQTFTATYTDDTAILASHHDPVAASDLLRHHLTQTEKWMKRWHIRVNETKSTHVTFTLRREDWTAVYLNGRHIPQDSTVTYLGIHLDRRLTWKTHIFAKRKHLGFLFQSMYWILGRKSELSLANIVLLYKNILKPIWTCGIPLWGTASHSNIEILQRFQNKALRTMVNDPWYIPNKLLHTGLPSGKKSRSLIQTIELTYSRIRIILRPTYLLKKAQDV